VNRRPLTALAVVNVVLHAAGLAAAAVGMRPGTPLAPLDERLDYLASAPIGWTGGWAVWMLCAAILIAFVFAVARRLDRPLASLALTLTAAGAAVDLACDAVFLAGFPYVASLRPAPVTLFLAVERLVGIASLTAANGLYSVSTLLLTLSLRTQPRLLPGTLALGYGVFACGMLLAAAGFTGVPSHAEWATPPTIGLYCAWALLVAHSLERPGP
jgi:hypothetical protein